ncbi:ubiquitin carboxyl-terminal hydrolase [Diplogelasinospora grovesii]|uniref:Ubiquitin carboxyl-terminal hydrolase n=1 Tax=Diplogelasinospora grovesii TaxID=303347 RepID=A0AAN6N104_9PEZI|nr:ubiquitin carboxyl-terminal hydrolase [Diplogelasinospora grovesii]
MNALAKKLGLSEDLAFYDVYSLDEPDLLAHIPRPAYALLVIIPLTAAWDANRQVEDSSYTRQEGNPPVIWFKQTIGHACGSIGLLHCAINGPAAHSILPGSALERLRDDALTFPAEAVEERAKMLYDSQPFEEAHKSVAAMGDTAPPSVAEGDHLGQHFVAFIKDEAQGHLWELEGSRKGPLDRGPLDDADDVLSPRALDLGLRRIIKLEQDSGGQDLRFSCIALAPRSKT